MSQPIVRRCATVGTLALILFMAGAGSVHARDLSSAGMAWGWLTEIWSKGASVVASWTGAPSPARNSRSAGSFQKEGPGVDPNGSPRPNGATTSNSACSTCGNEGFGLDPSGRH